MMEFILNGTTMEALKLVGICSIAIILFYFLGVWTAYPSRKEKQTHERIRVLEERLGMDADMLAAAKLMMEDAAINSQQSKQPPPQSWL